MSALSQDWLPNARDFRHHGATRLVAFFVLAARASQSDLQT